MRILLFSLVFLMLKLSAEAQEFVVSGFVINESTGEPIKGALVQDSLTQRSVLTNQTGHFSLFIPSGNRILLVSHPLFYPGSKRMYLGQHEYVRLFIDPVYDLYEVDTGFRIPGQAIPLQPDNESMQPNVNRDIPLILGENDPIKAIQLLPGVQPGLDGSSYYNVRGGGPDQNQVLLDGMPVYGVTHAFGFVSAINPEALSDMSFYKGNFSARYGSRLSSVLDISQKEGAASYFQGGGSLGIVTFSAFLNGPIVEDKTTVNMAFRRSMPGLLAFLSPVRGLNENEAAAEAFFDVYAKITHRLNEKDKLYFSYFISRDNFTSEFQDATGNGVGQVREQFKDQLFWSNMTGAVRWNHHYHKGKWRDISLGYTRYRYQVSSEYQRITETIDGPERLDLYARYLNGVQDYTFKADWEELRNPRTTWRYGAQAILHFFRTGLTEARFNSPSSSVDTSFGSVKPLISQEYSGYFETEYRLRPRWTTSLGLRGALYQVQGVSYPRLEPRWNNLVILDNHWTMRFGYSRMNQFLHMVTNSGLGFPSELWLPSTAQLKPSSADHINLGFQKELGNLSVLSIEGFYKLFNNLSDYSEGLGFLNVQTDPAQSVFQGKGRAYGAEFMLRRKYGRFTGWLAYTLSWSKRQFEEINIGREYYDRYDRRHQINITTTFNINDIHQFSANVVFGTGNPITFPYGRYVDVDGNVVFDYVEKNGYRLNDYFRLDLGYKNSKVRYNSDLEQSLIISLYNVTNRFNPVYMYVTSGLQVKEVAIFPFVPAITYTVRF